MESKPRLVDKFTVCEVFGPQGQPVAQRHYSEPVDPATFPAPGNWTHRWSNDLSRIPKPWNTWDLWRRFFPGAAKFMFPSVPDGEVK